MPEAVVAWRCSYFFAGAGGGAEVATDAAAAGAGGTPSFCRVLSCTCVGVPGLPEWHRLQFSADQASSPLWQEPQY